jgi:hypothetical protein
MRVMLAMVSKSAYRASRSGGKGLRVNGLTRCRHVVTLLNKRAALKRLRMLQEHPLPVAFAAQQGVFVSWLSRAYLRLRFCDSAMVQSHRWAAAFTTGVTSSVNRLVVSRYYPGKEGK